MPMSSRAYAQQYGAHVVLVPAALTMPEWETLVQAVASDLPPLASTTPQQELHEAAQLLSNALTRSVPWQATATPTLLVLAHVVAMLWRVETAMAPTTWQTEDAP